MICLAKLRLNSPWWQSYVAVLLFLAACLPFMFGLPVEWVMSAPDANFALLLVHGYAAAVHAGQWWPRWVPVENAGFGAPVFYYYGRLPFLAAALLGAILRTGDAASLLLTLCLFRILAFWSCRLWLRRHVEARAADCGALLFVAMPFAMMYNPLARVGFAETVATALLPLLFLLAEQAPTTARGVMRTIALLAIVYGAIAAIHLPQCMLGFAVVALYAWLRGGVSAFVLQAAGALGGLLLSADAVLPALRMQSWITPHAWEGNPYVEVRNNFLFTLSRYHLMHALIGEVWIYSSWLLCMGVVCVALFHPRFRAQRATRRVRALWMTVGLSLLAMTPVFWPVWVYIGPLRQVQFPWRLMPATLVASAGLAAALLGGRPSRQKQGLALLSVLVAIQLADLGLGAFVSLSPFGKRHHWPPSVIVRAPKFVAWSARETPRYALPRSSVPEYLPAAANRAGWHFENERLAPPNDGTVASPPTPRGLAESESGDGVLRLTGRLAAPVSMDLPLFYFPDESVSGSPAVSIQADPATGMARLQLPAGEIALRVAHQATPPSVRWGEAISAGSAIVILLCLAVSLGRPGRRGPGDQSSPSGPAFAAREEHAAR
jgi:hypothetical protein